MSNHLKVGMIDLILCLRRKGWSQRRITPELDLNHETVARYLKQVGSDLKPTIAPPGSDNAEPDPKPAIVPPHSRSLDTVPNPDVPPLGSTRNGTSRSGSRLSNCEPWRDMIQLKYNQGLSAQRIFQDLTCEHGFEGSYCTVRRFVRRLTPVLELPCRRLECEPGDEAQVDFGTAAPVITAKGKWRRTHL